MSYEGEGDPFYVNSATGWSKDRVYEVFGEVAARAGSVPMDYIVHLTGGAERIGNVQIRREFEALGVSRRGAHALMVRLDPPKLYGVLPYTWQSSVHALVLQHRTDVYLGRLQRTGAAHLFTDQSSGSTL